ncbi:MAG: hypothetical protein SP1CHLAM54_01160 [Chlamydiia bacterium]|nr:hypothetical protein [Chlamydiia bacterium]MCH9615038.1 hypothetical protein [Chlamydiia bacterium]MCH9629911.1 hypothetical protein [Chlamydiia bacterium]
MSGVTGVGGTGPTGGSSGLTGPEALKDLETRVNNLSSEPMAVPDKAQLLTDAQTIIEKQGWPHGKEPSNSLLQDLRNFISDPDGKNWQSSPSNLGELANQSRHIFNDPRTAAMSVKLEYDPSYLNTLHGQATSALAQMAEGNPLSGDDFTHLQMDFSAMFHSGQLARFDQGADNQFQIAVMSAYKNPEDFSNPVACILDGRRGAKDYNLQDMAAKVLEMFPNPSSSCI